MRTAIQTGGAILAFIWTAVSLVLGGLGMVNVFGWIVPWHWFALGGFLCFCGLTVWRMIELQQAIQEIRDAMPSVEVRPMRNDDYCLEVTNIGNTGTFEAQVQILEGEDFVRGLPQTYSAYWDRTKKDKSQILKGHKDKLVIATLEIPSDGRMSMNLCFYYYSSEYFQASYDEAIRYRHSNSWIVGSNQVVRPEFILRVTISSEPSLKEGAFTHNYELSSDSFTEMP